MDACDKAAELYKCGREKAPDLLAGVMVNLEIGLTVMAYFFINTQRGAKKSVI
jgi:hypothetical protein